MLVGRGRLHDCAVESLFIEYFSSLQNVFQCGSSGCQYQVGVTEEEEEEEEEEFYKLRPANKTDHLCQNRSQERYESSGYSNLAIAFPAE